VGSDYLSGRRHSAARRFFDDIDLVFDEEAMLEAAAWTSGKRDNDENRRAFARVNIGQMRENLFGRHAQDWLRQDVGDGAKTALQLCFRREILGGRREAAHRIPVRL